MIGSSAASAASFSVTAAGGPPAVAMRFSIREQLSSVRSTALSSTAQSALRSHGRRGRPFSGVRLSIASAARAAGMRTSAELTCAEGPSQSVFGSGPCGEDNLYSQTGHATVSEKRP